MSRVRATAFTRSISDREISSPLTMTIPFEIIAAEQVNQAYERLLKNDVRYRFVIDGATLRG